MSKSQPSCQGVKPNWTAESSGVFVPNSCTATVWKIKPVAWCLALNLVRASHTSKHRLALVLFSKSFMQKINTDSCLRKKKENCCAKIKTRSCQFCDSQSGSKLLLRRRLEGVVTWWHGARSVQLKHHHQNPPKNSSKSSSLTELGPVKPLKTATKLEILKTKNFIPIWQKIIPHHPHSHCHTYPKTQQQSQTTDRAENGTNNIVWEEKKKKKTSTRTNSLKDSCPQTLAGRSQPRIISYNKIFKNSLFIEDSLLSSIH